MNGTGSTLATRIRWPQAWRNLAAFVRRPELPERMTGIRVAALRPLLSLLALDILASSVLLGLFLALELAGLELPTNVLEGEDLTPGLLWLIAVVAPLTEELIFRSWLTGRPSAATIPKFGLIAVLLVGVAIGFGGPLAALAAAILILGLWIWDAIRRRGRPAPPWYVRRFSYFYFGSATASRPCTCSITARAAEFSPYWSFHSSSAGWSSATPG